MSSLDRPRKLELLHTPKAELARMMRENSINIDEMTFLFSSNKINVADIRLHSPSICDKLVSTLLRHAIQNSPPTEEQSQGEIPADTSKNIPELLTNGTVSHPAGRLTRSPPERPEMRREIVA